MIGDSSALAAALDHLSRLAPINRPVLVLGERGTGKELAAQRLHFLSSRWDAPLLKVNCAAMAETLLESELFGHEAGAFTGATRSHQGRFERADGGTLFLDELATMSPRLQEKLLRLVEYGEFERVGGQKTHQVDVRVVAATNADLPAMAEAGEFRHDLLDRLSFDIVHLPPLRVRHGDTLTLAEHFAIQMSAELGWDYFPGFSDRAVTQLTDHQWPGNVRELKNVVERSLYRWGDAHSPVDDIVTDPFQSPYVDAPEIQTEPDDVAQPLAPLPDTIRGPDTVPLQERVTQFERELVERALVHAGGNQRLAAQQTQLSYNQMRGLVRKHDLGGRRRSN